MTWSFRIATVAGIPVFVHVTFVALIAFVFLQDWARGQDVRAALGGVLFILAIFGTVVLHEFGHAFMARAYGIATKDITLLPIGGLARLERMPEVPRQELWVALARAGRQHRARGWYGARAASRPACRWCRGWESRRSSARRRRPISAGRSSVSSSSTSGWRSSI